MGVAVRVGSSTREIGTPSFFTAFFSTIVVRLEDSAWGSRFPVIMGELYEGFVPSAHATTALGELRQIRDELAPYPPESVVWNFEDLSQRPPWGDRIAAEISNLSRYFVTSHGEDLITTLEEAFEESRQSDKPLKVS